MEAVAFLDIAFDLAALDNPSECDCRTGISRAYYASFLASLGLLRDLNVAPSNMNRNVHSEVHQRLWQSRDPQLRIVAKTLQALSVTRRKSDYDLRSIVTYDELTLSIGQATDVIDKIGAVRSEMASNPALGRSLSDTIRSNLHKIVFKKTG